MAQVVVLGGNGFLGSHVVRLLAERGVESVVLSRRSGCDITRPGELRRRLAELGPEAVINCAAHVGSIRYVMDNAAEVIHDNTLIAANLYRAVREACPGAVVINPISNCSYPGEADRHVEAHWQDGPVHDSVLAYASPRRLIHALAACYHRQHGLRSVNWLIANAYGPGDYTDPGRVHALNGIVMRMILAQRAGDHAFEIWGSGRPMREWVYVEDVARILVESLGMAEQVYPVNLAQDRAYSIAEIAEMVRDALGYDVELTYDRSKPDGAPIKVLDDSRFREARPGFRFTPLQEGLANTIAYYGEALA